MILYCGPMAYVKSASSTDIMQALPVASATNHVFKYCCSETFKGDYGHYYNGASLDHVNSTIMVQLFLA